MNNRKHFCAAAILSLALTIPTFAGEVQTPTCVPPPPPNSATASVQVPGDEVNSPAAEQELSDATSDLFLDLLFGMLSLY
jgi:hypothetical protein